MASQAALDLIINLRGADQADSTLGRLSGTIGKVGGLAAGLGKAALFTGIGAAVGGIAGLGAAISGGVADARDAALVFAQTEQVIKSTGGAAGLTATQVADMAASLSAAEGQSLFGDSDIQEAQNLLLTFTKIGKETFPDATQAMVDMATAMGTDVSSGAIQLGKALNDPVAGIGALSRVGVQFSKEQQEMIKNMVKTGDVAGAQQVILKELEVQFGGSAAAAAAADGGMAQFRDRLGEAAETIGGAFLPVLGNMGALLNSPAVMGAIEGVAGALANGIGNAITWLTTTGIPGMIAAWQTIQPALATVVGLIQTGFGLARDAVLTFIQALQGNWEDSAERIAPIHRAFGIVGTVIREQVIPAVMSVVDWFQRNWETISQVGAAIGIAVVAFQTISTVVGVVSGAIATVVGAWGALTAAVTGAGSVIGAIVAVLGGPLTIAIGAIALAVGGLYLAWQNNWGGIQEKTAAVIGWLRENVWAWLQGTAFPWLTGTALPALRTAWDVAWSGIKVAVGATYEWLSGTVWPFFRDVILPQLVTLMQNTRREWETAWPLIKAAVSATFDWLVNTAWPAIQTAFRNLQEWLSTLQRGWDTSFNAIRNTVQGLYDKVVEVKDNVIAAFRAIPEAISGLAGSFTSAASSLGSGLISGIISGLSGLASRVAETITGAVTSAINAAKGALGIRSPSRVTQDEIGEPMGLGIAHGIESSTEAIKYAFINTLADAARTAKAGVGQKGEDLGKHAGIELAMGIEWSKDTIRRALAGAIEDAARTTMPVADRLGSSLGSALSGGVAGSADTVCQEIEKINDCLGGIRTTPGAPNMGISLGAAVPRPPDVPGVGGGPLAGAPRIGAPSGTVGTNRPFGGAIGGVSVTINAAPGMDERSIAEIAIQAVRREQRLEALR